MSLRFTLFLLLALFFTACEKLSMDEEIAEEVTAPVDDGLVIRVAQFESRAFEKVNTTDAELSCTHLNFAVYDMMGTRIKQVNQKAGDIHYGTASFPLENGDYQLVILAHSSTKNPTMTNPSKIQFSNAIGYTDTYLYYTTVTITDHQITLVPDLKRIVSMCRFVISDPIPNDVVSIKFEYTGGSGYFNATTGLGVTNSKQNKTFSVPPGQQHTTYDLYTFLHEEEGTISLIATAFDFAGNECCAWDFQIPMKKNHITWLTGKFFTEETDGWTIVPKAYINSSWEGETIYEYN